MRKIADYRLLYASGQVDAVLITTPHYSHSQVAIEALRCGLHALVDKPLACGRRSPYAGGIPLRKCWNRLSPCSSVVAV